MAGSEVHGTAGLWLAFGSDGRGLLSWTGSVRNGLDPGYLGPVPSWVFSSVLGAAGPTPAERVMALKGSFRDDRLVLLGSGVRALVSSGRPARDPAGGKVWVQTGPLTGPLGGRRALFRHANVEDVAVGARGDLAVTVLRPRSLQHGLPVNDAWLAVRRPGGAVRRTLVARGAGATAVAVNAGGDALLVYDRLRVTSRPGVVHRFFARLLTRHGRWMQGHAIGRVYSPNPGNSSDAVVAALDSDRRAVAGWRHHECEEGACFSAPAAVTVATRGAEFGRTIMLEQTTGLVVVSAGPRAVVAFSGPDGVRRAAVIGRGLGRPVQVSTPGLTAQVQGLAVDRRGAAALLWTESATANDYNLGEPSALRAIVRPAGGRFGAPESVLDEPVAYGSAVGLAFDRRTGGPVAAVHDAPFDTRLPDVPVVIARR